MTLSWTQPVCVGCWDLQNPNRPATRLLTPDTETCCYCGESTRAGIYVRVDPRTVPYPCEDEE